MKTHKPSLKEDGIPPSTCLCLLHMRAHTQSHTNMHTGWKLFYKNKLFETEGQHLAKGHLTLNDEMN